MGEGDPRKLWDGVEGIGNIVVVLLLRKRLSKFINDRQTSRSRVVKRHKSAFLIFHTIYEYVRMIKVKERSSAHFFY